MDLSAVRGCGGAAAAPGHHSAPPSDDQKRSLHPCRPLLLRGAPFAKLYNSHRRMSIGKTLDASYE